VLDFPRAVATRCSRWLQSSEVSDQAVIGKTLQILACRFGCHISASAEAYGAITGPRRVRVSSLSRARQRRVLVVEMDVDRVVAGLRHAPRHVTLIAIRDLPRHCR